MPALLRALAEAFSAQDAGLATSLSAPCHGGEEFPWENQAEVLAQLRTAPAAVTARGQNGASWLAAPVWQPDKDGWLLWLQDGPERTWSEGEKAALLLAGQALARLVAVSPTGARFLERARIQRRFEDAVHVTGRLAHDFGNILTGILGFAELSLGQLPPDSPCHLYLREVCQSAHLGVEWIRKLQVVGRRSKPKNQAISLAAVVADMESRLRTAWGSTLAFLVCLPPDLPPVAMDGTSLGHLLEQVLQNAREAISGRGVVTLSCRTADLNEDECLELIGNAKPGRHVEITITDTGGGFDPDTRRRLFHELFVSTKTRHRGLGLAMVYGILNAFQGGVRFGPDPEQGTAVRLFVPLAEAAQKPGPLTPSQAKEKTGILVVDDDPLVLEVVSHILENAGYRVKAVPGSQEAIEQYKSGEPYDLVIADVVMPRLNGFEMARQIQAHDPAALFLFITSQSAHGMPAADILQDFTLLRKPFVPAELVQAVAGVLAKRSPATIKNKVPAKH